MRFLDSDIAKAVGITWQEAALTCFDRKGAETDRGFARRILLACGLNPNGAHPVLIAAGAFDRDEIAKILNFQGDWRDDPDQISDLLCVLAMDLAKEAVA